MNLPDFLERQPSGSIRLAGSRIALEHLVEFYNEGFSPEMLLAQFPTLSLAQIHKAIAYYLDHAAEVDAYVANCRASVAQQRIAAPPLPSLHELRQRLNQLDKVTGQKAAAT
jgi:uncharacterized protein (DUF433 family)